MTDTLAITGASGFLGRHLVRGCRSREELQVRLLTRSRGALEPVATGNVSVYEGDLLQPESLDEFLHGASVLVHLAYLHEGRDANMRAVAHLAGVAASCGIKRVVHCSSAVVVGFRARGTVTEETPAEPRGEYQQTKYRIEETLRAGLPGVELAILRPSEIIGPGGEGLRSMIGRLREGRSLKNYVYHCLLKHRRFNYVTVHNVVAALLLLACSPVAQRSEVYNLSDDDDPDNHYAAVEAIISACLGLKPEYGPDVGLPASLLSALYALLPAASPPHRVYSQVKIASLGYRKATTLRAAISEVVSYELAREAPGGLTRKAVAPAEVDALQSSSKYRSRS